MLYILVLILLTPLLLWSATFTVSTNADSGAGSLRQAIVDLNASVDASNTININSSLGTISLSSSLPAINHNVQMNGPVVSQAIQANNRQVFFINSGLTVAIANIDITGAKATGAAGGVGAGGGGGGVGAGGGVFVSSAANVTITNVTFTSCNATGGTGGAGGASTGGGGGGGFVTGSSGSGNNGGGGGSPAGGGGGGRGGNILAAGGTGGISGGGSAAAGQNGTMGGALNGGPGGAGGSGDTYGGGGGGGQGGNGTGLGSNGGNGGNGAVGGFGGGGGGGAGGGTGILTTGAPGTGAVGGFNGGTGGGGSGTGTGGGGGGAGLGGAIFVNGTGTLTIVTPSGSFFVTNSVTVGSGGAGSGAGAAGTAGSAAGLDLFLTSGGSCTFNVPSGTATLSNPIVSNQSGSSGSLIKSGAGTLDFATNNLSNTYTGTTTINDGILSIASNNNLGTAAGAIAMNTGVGVTPTLSIASAVSINRSTTLSGTQAATFTIQTGASLTHSGSLGLSTANLIVDAAPSTTSTLSGVVSGVGGSLTKNGAGTLTLSNTSNTYSGGTTVNAGTLVISSDGNLGNTSGPLTLSGGTLQTNATLSSARAVSLSSTSTINTNGNDLTLSGVASGTGSLTKMGTGTLFYTGTSANTYSGLTTVTAGSLTLNKTTGISALSGDVLISGGTLNLSVAHQIADTSGVTLSSGTFNMAGNAETLASLTYQAGTFSQGGATLTLAGASTALTMRDTTISGNLALTGGGSIVFDSTNNGTAALSGNLDLGGSTTTFNIADGSAATDMSLSGIVSNGGITKTSAGRLELSGASANTFTGTTTVSAGELFLNKTTGINAILGDVLINGGTLTLNAANQIANTSAMTLSSGTFNMVGNAETLASLTYQAGTFSQGGATLTLAGAGTALTMRNTTLSGNITLAGGGIAFDSTNNGTATISGNLDLGGSTTTFNIADGAAATDMSLSGIVSNGGITKISAGRLELSGASANTFTGTTTVSAGELFLNKTTGINALLGNVLINGGTLTLNVANQIANTSAMTLSSGTFNMAGNAETLASLTYQAGTFSQGGATLTLAGAGTALTMRNVAISGNMALTGGGIAFDSTNNGTATISGNLDLGGATTTFNIADGSAATDMSLSGIVSNGGVTKTSAGRLELTGTSANTFAGTTTVSAGELFLNKTAGINAIAGDILINGGTLTLNAANQIANTSTMTLSSGTFNMAGNAETITTLLFQGGSVSSSGTTLTLTSGITALNMRNTTFGENLALTGGGSVVFDSTNNGTAVISGNLDLGGSTTTFNIADGTAATDMSLNGVVSNGGITKITAGRLELTGTGANTFAGTTTVSAGELLLNKTSGTNAVSGDVLINGGTLTLNATNQIANTSVMTLSSGTFNMAGNAETLASLTYQAGTVSQGGATLTLAGAGTVLTMRNVAISGNIALAGGSVAFDSTNNGTAIISGNLDLGGSTTVFNIADGSAATDMSLSGIVSNGGVTKTSAGRLELAGTSTNTFTGTTTVSAGELFLNKTAGINAISGDVLINGGTLTLNAANQIANTSAMTLSSGTFNMVGNAETLASLNYQAGTVSQGGATLTLAGVGTVLTMRNTTLSGNITLAGGGIAFDSTNNGTASISGNIDLGGATTVFNIVDGAAATDMSLSGIISNGGVTKTSAGRLELAGASANTFTGTTTVSAGELFLNKTAGIHAVSGDVLINGGTLTLNAPNQIANTSVVTLSSGTFNMAGNAETLAGLTYQAGTFSQGGAPLTLAGAGTVLTMRNVAISGNVALAGGSVAFDSTNNGTASISGNLDLGGSTTIFDIANGTAATDMSLSGIVSNGGVTKASAGRLELTGASANTFTGTTTVSAGELFLNKTAGMNAIPGDILISGGTLTLNAANQIANTSVVTLSSGTFNMAGNAETITSFLFQGGSASSSSATLTLTSGTTALNMRNTTFGENLALIGGGSIVFDSTNNGTAVISGNLDLGGSTTTFNIADGAAATDMSLSGVVSNGGVTKTSAGRLELTGVSANTFTGTTMVSAGELFLNKTAGMNAIPGDILISGGTLTLNAANQIANTSVVTLSSGTFNMVGNAETLASLTYQAGTFSQGGATLTLAGASTVLTMRNVAISGNIALTGGGSVVFDNTNNGTASISGNLDLGGSTATFNIADGTAATDMSLSGVVSNGGVTKTSAGRLELAGVSANTFTGTTTVSAGELFLNKTAGMNAIPGDILISGGTLTLNAANQIANTSVVTLSSGTFNMAGNAETLASLTYQAGTFSQGGATLMLAGASTALTMRNVVISGNLALTGGGSVVFDNTNNGTASISGNLDLGGSTTTFNIADGTAATDMLLGGIISNGGITKTSAGRLELTGTGANTFTGTTTVSAGELFLNKTSGNALPGDVLINGGTLTLNAPNQIVNTSVMTLSSGEFDMDGNTEIVASLNYQAGVLSQGGATLILTGAGTALTMRNVALAGHIVLTGGGSVAFDSTNNGTASISGNLDLGGSPTTFDIADGTAATDMSLSGVVSNGGITKISSGRLELAGASANTFTGTTTVSAGELFLNKTAGINAVSGDVLINGGTLILNAANQIVNTSTMTLSSGTFNMAGNAETLASLTYQAGTFSQGGATLTLAGAGTALTVRNVAISGNIALAGGGIAFDSTNNGTATISGNLDLGGATTTFNIADGSAATDMALSGIISNGGVTKTSSGRLELTGTSANTFAGTTTVSAGELFLNKTAGINAIAGDILIDGGTLILNAANQIANTSVMILSSGTFNMAGNAETITSLLFQGGSASSSGATLTLTSGTTALNMRNTTFGENLALIGGGSVVFDSANNGTAVISGNLDLGGVTTTFDIANGSAATDMSLSGIVSNGGITKISAGRLELSGTGANTFAGTTTVSAGELLLNKTAGVSAVSGDVLINGGTLTLNAANQIANTSMMTLSSGTFSMAGNAETLARFNYQAGTLSQGGATLTLVGSGTALTMRNVAIFGNIALTGGGSVVFDNTNNGTAIVSGNFDLGGVLTTFDVANGSAATDLSLSGIVSNGGITKISAGRLEFAGTSANLFTGMTTVSAGELFLNKNAGLNAIPGDVLINGGTLTLNAANQIANTSTVTLSSGTFNMAGNAETLARLNYQAGTLSQGGATLTLAGAGIALTMRDTTISDNIVLAGGGIAFDSTNNGTATLSGNLDLGGSTTTFDIANGTAATDMLLSGIISNGGITKISPGQLELAGAGTNTFTGTTTVGAGELFLNKPAGTNAVTGDVLINGGTLTLNAANQISNTSAVTLSSGTFNMAGNAETLASFNYQAGTLNQGGATLTLAGPGPTLTMRNVAISGNIALTGGGDIVFDNTNNGAATISGNLDLGGSTTTVNIADGSMAIDGIISNGAVIKIGSGTLAHSGMNTYMGGTTVNGGRLIVSSDEHLGDPSGSLTLGTATLQTHGSLSSSRSINIVGASTIDTYSNDVLLQGDATGGGSLFKQNAGTLTLRGSNGYTGGTTVAGGILKGDTTSLQGSIFNQTTVIFDQAMAGTYAGVLSGGGSVIKTNAGTLILTGANNYSGGTTVSAGVLQGNTTSLQGDIFNQAAVVFDQAVTDTYAGVITGTGSVTKQNGGTLIFSAEHHYSGGTVVSAGVLQGNTRSLQGNIQNLAALVFQQNDPGAYAGTLTGTGVLIKEGDASLTLSGSVSQSMTLVNLGELNVNGTLTSSVLVASSAMVGGTGTVVGSITNQGKVAPGNSIGTLTVQGDYLQAASSTLEIEISPMASSLLQVSGNVTLQPGTVLEIVPEAGVYKDGTIYTFLTTGGAVSGQFSEIVVPFTCLSGSSALVYSPDRIQLILCIAPFSQLVAKGNAGAVASVLDKLTNPSPDLQRIIGRLQLLSREKLASALNQMQPSLFKATTILQQNAVTLASLCISQRLQNNYLPCKDPDQKPAHFWIAPLFEQSYQQKKGEELGWQGQTEMILAGGDYGWGETFYAGAALGYAANQIHWKDVKSKGHFQSYLGQLYGSWVSRSVYINTILSAGSNHLSESRNIQFPGFNRTARHHQNAPFVQADAEVGGLLTLGRGQIRPFGNLSYLYIDEKSYSERGANSLNLEVKDCKNQFLRSELGINFSGCFTAQNSRWIPEVKCSWVRENRLENKKFTARFRGTTPYFTVKGLYPSRNLLSLGAALTFQKLLGLKSVSLFYSSQMAHRYFDQSFSFLINCPF